MNIQYASDLHLEFMKNKKYLFSNKLQIKADILVLAGDILPFYENIEKEKYLDFLSESFKEVYWLPGNHEYYNSDIVRYHKFHEKVIRKNIYVKTNQTVSIKGINLIFTTLWSKISSINELYINTYLSDFSLIKYDGVQLTPEIFNRLHKDSILFLEGELRNRQKEKNIVITHHVPTFLNYPEKFKHNELNEAFVSELHNIIEKYQPEVWIYGHSHINTPEFKIGITRMLTNQLGYIDMKEHANFKLDAVIEI